LVEVLCALVIVTVGAVSMGLLATRAMATGRLSKYMSLASTLASEKLEDLSRWPVTDQHICVPTGSAWMGDLGSDVLQSVTCPAGTNSVSISYYDDVSISVTEPGDCPNVSVGCFAETIWNGSQYTTTYHSPDGVVQTNNNAVANMTFHRRWMIEADTPVTGVRRVTVLVTLMDQTVQPPVSFQMSLVRP
jgi:Tfp pilus assembly protein PilV